MVRIPGFRHIQKVNIHLIGTSNINLRLTCEIHGYVPIAHKLIQTSLELLMSQSKNAHAPIFSGSCGEDLTNATKFQVQGSVYSSKGKEDLLCG